MNEHTMRVSVTALIAGAAIATMGSSPAVAQQLNIQVTRGQSTNRTSVKSSTKKSTATVAHRNRQRLAQNVTLNLQNAPVKAALMQLFQKAHRDYSLSDDISGIVTLRLTDRPFNETLRLIAENASTPLSYTMDSGVYFVKPRPVPVTRQVAATEVTQPVATRNTDPLAFLPEDPAQLAADANALSPAPRYVTNPYGIPGYNGQIGGVSLFPGYSTPMFGTPIMQTAPQVFTYPNYYGTPYGASWYSPLVSINGVPVNPFW